MEKEIFAKASAFYHTPTGLWYNPKYGLHKKPKMYINMNPDIDWVRRLQVKALSKEVRQKLVEYFDVSDEQLRAKHNRVYINTVDNEWELRTFNIVEYSEKEV